MSFSNGFEESRGEPSEPREHREPRESSPASQDEPQPQPQPREVAAASSESHRPATHFEPPPPVSESGERKPFVVWSSAPSPDRSREE